MGCVVTYIALGEDGSHSNPMSALCKNEKTGRTIIADMVAKHENDPLYMDVGYRMTLSRDGNVIFEESRGAQ